MPTALAQDRDQFIKRAGDYYRTFTQAQLPTVVDYSQGETQKGSPLSLKRVMVDTNTCSVYLFENGDLEYMDVAVLESSAGTAPRSDDEYWNRAEELLAKAGIAVSYRQFIRSTQKTDGTPTDVMSMTWGEKVNGLDTPYMVSMSMRKSDGAVLSVYCRPSFTYEPLNVKVSPDEACALAARKEGGDSTDWTAKLEYAFQNSYSSSDPDAAELAKARIMRPCYMCTRPFDLVIVDSVNGSLAFVGGGVLSASQRAKLPKPPPPQAPPLQRTKPLRITPWPTLGAKREPILAGKRSSTQIAPLILGAVAIGGASALVLSRRRRVLRHR